MRKAVVCLIISLLIMAAIPVNVFALGRSSPSGWNPIQDIINKIREAILSAINWIVDQINHAFWGAF
ncbi:MAG: hypothetical protein GXO43_00765, partial [Crenarchaeota archaeon]|nr:hypothetical protein [Thermoproteota archaeon]